MLYWFTLTKSYIQFSEIPEYSLSNQKPDYKHTTIKKVIITPSDFVVLTELQMKKEI